MNVERAREFLLGLPHVVETEQWGGVVYWVGDKAIGGKMFCMMNPEAHGKLPVTFTAGAEVFAELCELEGLVPAPYLARIFWVSAERWDVLRNAEWEDLLRTGHEMTYAKLPPKVKATLELPKAELKRTVAERRKVLAAKAAAKKG